MKYSKKNPSVDLQKKRPTLLLLGTFAALGISLMAFEWKTFLPEPELDPFAIPVGLEDEPAQISFHTPPPPPPPKPKVEINLVLTEEEPDEPVDLTFLDVDVEEETLIDIEEDIEIIDEPDAPYIIVDLMPEFPGGNNALFSYLGRETEYPSLARDSGIEGVVYVTFVVETDGSIDGVKVLRGIGGGCDEEAVRVVSSMPTWAPGEQNGRKVRVQYNLPYRFTLRN
jgi:protein TonB